MIGPPATSAIAPLPVTSFGDLLKYLRRRARLTQRDLAAATGYSVGQICRLEHNQRLPDTTALAALFIPALQLESEPELSIKLLQLATDARNTAVAPQERVTLPTIVYEDAYEESDMETRRILLPHHGGSQLRAVAVLWINADDSIGLSRDNGVQEPTLRLEHLLQAMEKFFVTAQK